MNKYRIYDLSAGLLADNITVNAGSPKDALAKAGYKDITRDRSGKYGNIVVYGPRGSYVYTAHCKEA